MHQPSVRYLLFLLALTTSALAGPSYDALLTGYRYPFEVHRFQFSSQNQQLSMAYMDIAPAHGNGRTVMLLHGKNFTGAYWEPTIRALSQAGYRVVVPDQIGFGKSTKPECYQFSFAQLATNTQALLKSLGLKRVAVVGHSIGGMLATRFALMFPETTEKLVLVNPIGLEDWKRVVPYHTVDEDFATELASTPEKVRHYMQENYFAGAWKPEYEYLVTPQAGWLLGPDRRKTAWVAALTTDMAITQPVLYEFGDLKGPVLLIIGQKDRTALGKAWASPAVKAQLGLYPQLGRKAHAAIRNSKLVELAQSGHLPQVTEFDLYRKALLEFLGER